MVDSALLSRKMSSLVGLRRINRVRQSGPVQNLETIHIVIY